MIEVSNLSKVYHLDRSKREFSVLDKISFNLNKGSFCSIVGPSGSGKTTLINCLTGLLPFESGSISLNGMTPDEARKKQRIGVVFQKPVFFEWKTILDNITLFAQIAGRDDAIIRAMNFLKEFNLDKFAKAYPHQLSGGMLARVAIARCLVHSPTFVFFDEAFNNLDESLRDRINMDIQKYWLDNHPSIISITHSVQEAVLLSDIVFVFSKKPARIVSSFEIPFSRPRKLKIRKDINFVHLVETVRDCLSKASLEEKNEI